MNFYCTLIKYLLQYKGTVVEVYAERNSSPQIVFTIVTEYHIKEDFFMKRFISILLAVVMIASLSVIAVSAAGDQLTVTVSGMDGKTETKAFNIGDTFSVYSVLNTKNICSGYVGSLTGTMAFDQALVGMTNATDEDDVLIDTAPAFPVLDEFEVANHLVADEGLYFTCSIAGIGEAAALFDTNKSVLVKLDFVVKAAGETTISTTLRTLAQADATLTRTVEMGVVKNSDFVLHSTFIDPAELCEVGGTVTSR